MVGAQVSQNQKANDTIDILRDYQYGRNGSIEYKWSNFSPERYVQLYYQIAHDYPDPEIASKVREKIISEYRFLLQEAISIDNKNDQDQMYRMLLQSRDRKEGKGLWSISLYLLCEVASLDYPRFLDIFKRIVGAHENTMESERLGCWRDYRVLQLLLQKDEHVAVNVDYETRRVASKDIETICINNLVQDVLKMERRSISHLNTTSSPSMLGKWFPREKGKFGWLFNQMYRRIKKEKVWTDALKINSKSDLRHILSKLNKELKTLEVKQCERRWHTVDFGNVSHSRIARQVDAFMGKSKSNWSKEVKDTDNVDRRLCKKMLLDHTESCDPSQQSLVSMIGEETGKIVQMASQCNAEEEPEKAKMINKLWYMQMMNIKGLWRKSHHRDALFYPLVDVSSSMKTEYTNNSNRTRSSAQVYAAIAIGLSLAHISSHDSIVIFGTYARIVDIASTDDSGGDSGGVGYCLCEVVKDIISSPCVGTLSDIRCALTKFKETYRNGENQNRDYLTIISDFQFSPYFRVGGANIAKTSTSSLHQAVKDTIPVSRIVNDFVASMNCVTTPSTILWNMTSTDGFPGLSFFEKTVYISGTNPRDIISALRPLKVTEKRGGKVPKRVKGLSSCNSNLSNIDGNNVLWNTTPCYYLYRTMNRDRYSYIPPR